MDGTMFAPLSAEEEATAKREAKPKATKIPIVPVPADAPPMKFRHPHHGEPTRSWPYHTADGGLVGYVCRWDFIDAEGQRDKTFLPVMFCDLGNGKRAWRSKGFPSPRPLFDLPGILARPDAMVLIAEGEKTRDAAALLFPDMVATTPAHGAESPQLTDFSSLAGRRVVIATDFDTPGRVNDKGKPLHPGRTFGDKVCGMLRAAGAAEVLHLHPERLGAWCWQDGEKVLRGEPLPDGWDLADALAEGWTAEAVAAAQTDPTFLAPYRDGEQRQADQAGADASQQPAPEPFRGWPFRMAWNGVEKRIERVDKDTGITIVEWRWFCSSLDVAAETRSETGEEWGRLLTIVDRDDRSKSWAMPMAMLAGDGTTYRERLLSLGLILAPGRFARDALHEYIATARPTEKARCVSRVGWHGRAFVMADETLGAAHG